MKTKLLYKIIFTLLLTTTLQINAQTNWVTKSSGISDTLLAVQFLDANNGFACGKNGTVIKTTDGGDSWSSVSISTNFPVNDISFISTSIGWAAVGDLDDADNTGELWKTTDGGASWAQQTYYSSTRARLGISFADANTGWACGSRNGPLDVANTTDGGTNYTEQTDGAIFGWTYKVDAISTTDLWVAGGAFFPSVTGMILHSTDGGGTWALQSLGTIPFTYDVEAVNSNTIYIVGDQGYITATTDGGSNWAAQTSGTTDILWRISFSNTTTGLSCGDNGTIIGTTDGSTWASETSGTTSSLYGVYMLDGTTAWAVGADGTIIKREVTTGTEDNQIISNINVFPNPFSNYTTITIEGIDIDKNPSFILFDALGNIVLQKSINNPSFTLEKNQLAKGLYHYAITSNNSILNRGKIIIQ